jgi:hypothetical protein
MTGPVWRAMAITAHLETGVRNALTNFTGRAYHRPETDFETRNVVRMDLQYLGSESIVARGVGTEIRRQRVLARPSEVPRLEELLLGQSLRQLENLPISSIEVLHDGAEGSPAMFRPDLSIQPWRFFPRVPRCRHGRRDASDPVRVPSEKHGLPLREVRHEIDHRPPVTPHAAFAITRPGNCLEPLAESVMFSSDGGDQRLFRFVSHRPVVFRSDALLGCGLALESIPAIPGEEVHVEVRQSAVNLHERLGVLGLQMVKLNRVNAGHEADVAAHGGSLVHGDPARLQRG